MVSGVHYIVYDSFSSCSFDTKHMGANSLWPVEFRGMTLLYVTHLKWKTPDVYSHLKWQETKYSPSNVL